MDNTPCTYRISVKALIRDDQDRILLLQEADGSWELPGGGLDHGEDAKTGLTREISEETGMTVDWMSDAPVAFWTIRKDVGSSDLHWFSFVVFEAKVSGSFRPDPTGEEAVQAQYFSRDDAKKLQLHDNIKPYFS